VPISLTISLLLGADLIRVDTPDHPAAIATSSLGSTLLEPPDEDTPWREEPIPVLDTWEAIEAIEAVNADAWHDAGIDGAGVRIAVFDLQWFGVELNENLSELSTHDCFGHRSCAQPINTIHPQFAFETGGHGIACAEVIQTIAPGAELILVRVNSLTALENAVDWAVHEGIDIVSMSMSFFNESFYDGSGSINAAVDVLVAGGVLMVTSAGNYAQQHYKDVFTDTDRDNRHEFKWGSEYLPLYLPEGTTKINLIWDDFGDCGSTDLDGYVYNTDGALVGRSTRSQRADEKGCRPTETIHAKVSESDWHYLLVHRAAGRPDARFDVSIRAGTVYEAIAESSVTDPGSHPHAFTVGAVHVDGYANNPVQTYSSQGPTSAGVTKPDIVGPDGLTSSVYGNGRFFGTSAATPVVAALVALVMSEDPSLTPREAATALQATAKNDGAVWAEADPTMGAGKAHLPSLEQADTGCGGGTPLLMIFCWIPFGRFRSRN
jgi:subtilisin family serine protease